MVMRRTIDPTLTISVVGFGNVGRSLVHELLNEQEDTLINIVDPGDDIEGSVLDLGHGAMLSPHIRFELNNFSTLPKSDYIFVCAGACLPPGESRDYGMEVNEEIMREVFHNFPSHSSKARVIVLSNPVDTMSLCVWKASGLPAENVVGVGTMLDSLRLEYNIKAVLGDKAHDIRAMVIGEHGDNMLPVLSHTFVNQRPITEILPPEVIGDCIFECRQAAEKIKRTQGASYYGAARCAIEIMNQWREPEDVCYPISVLHTLPDGTHLYYSTPVKFTSRGLFNVKDFHLTPEEKQALDWSIQKLVMTAERCFEPAEKNQ